MLQILIIISVYQLKHLIHVIFLILSSEFQSILVTVIYHLFILFFLDIIIINIMYPSKELYLIPHPHHTIQALKVSLPHGA